MAKLKFNPVNSIKIVAGSFSLCLLLSFFAFELFLEYCPSKDLQFLGPNQLKDRPPVLNKLKAYDEEHQDRPTIILVGSSLAQYASNLCDFGQYGRPDLNKEFASYSRFRYLDEVLARSGYKGPGKLETANLSNSGAMISEDFLIIKEALLKKNPPRAIVLEIGPRDFIDNMTPDPYRSRLAQVLSKKQEPFVWRRDRSVTENVDLTAEKLSLFYSMRGELHDCLVKMACDNLHHPASVYQATLMAKLAPPPVADPAEKTAADPGQDQVAEGGAKTLAEGGKGTMKFGHIDDNIGSEKLKEYSVSEYKGRYLPVNRKKWSVELGCFKDLIAFCGEKKIPLIIVNMPLTERNLAVLPDDFKNEYESTVGKICRDAERQNPRFGYVDLRHDNRFELSDFRDTVHMRSPGGKKLADLLGPIVAEKIAAPSDAADAAKFAGKPTNLN
ncbi:MAG: hypothetical protein JSS83_01550 [Cyanobacteria bacterium SZAS LIN-3]|nr:hypothetical protein [Cyanobacteria bacterium SZAS LIN-3]MBS2007845.1 hypothetical protein [Cyanobacteria bacterium SZAS TMP-1]